MGILKKPTAFHFRISAKILGIKDQKYLPIGGATAYYDPDEYGAHVGISLCSLKDVFCKRTGFIRAKGFSESTSHLTIIDTQEVNEVVDVITKLVKEKMKRVYKNIITRL